MYATKHTHTQVDFCVLSAHKKSLAEIVAIKKSVGRLLKRNEFAFYLNADSHRPQRFMCLCSSCYFLPKKMLIMFDWAQDNVGPGKLDWLLFLGKNSTCVISLQDRTATNSIIQVFICLKISSGKLQDAKSHGLRQWSWCQISIPTGPRLKLNPKSWLSRIINSK